MSNGTTDLFNMSKPEKEKYKDLEKALSIIGIESPNICYQCSKCTSGCEAMKLLELQPHSIMASAKDGFIEEIMQSDKIWDCVGCYKCVERCPQKMSPVDLMYIIKNWCVYSGKQLPGDYQKLLQSILTTGYTQNPLDVSDKKDKTCNRSSLGLPEIKGPKDQQKFIKIISEFAMEVLK
jgi:heterodisulfide reductase subunit C2